MYNRYIPQSDGSFRRNTVQERKNTPPPKHCPAAPPSKEPEISHPTPQQQSPLGFLKNLLPKDFDTGDLLIVLLLLLMAGDCGEDQNTAILTLALYLFL